jgi:hypothetical protein
MHVSGRPGERIVGRLRVDVAAREFVLDFDRVADER